MYIFQVILMHQTREEEERRRSIMILLGGIWKVMIDVPAFDAKMLYRHESRCCYW